MSDNRLDKKTEGDFTPAPDTTGMTAHERLNNAEFTTFSNENASLGTALRSIYQKTVEESVPPEMLDLLNRLN